MKLDKVLHIGTELVVIGGGFMYLKNENSKLQEELTLIKTELYNTRNVFLDLNGAINILQAQVKRLYDESSEDKLSEDESSNDDKPNEDKPNNNQVNLVCEDGVCKIQMQDDSLIDELKEEIDELKK